jgi:hypothetical protein
LEVVEQTALHGPLTIHLALARQAVTLYTLEW